MEKDQEREIRELLEQRQSDLKKVLLDSEDVLRAQIAPDPGGESHIDFNHPADMVQGDSDYEKELELVHRARSELAVVHSALERLDASEYGECLSCGDDIPFARLKALPYAKLCVRCQTLEESDQADRASRINRTRTDEMGERSHGLVS